MVCEIFSCSTQTLSRGSWDVVPWSGIEPSPLHWSTVLAARPPAKFPLCEIKCMSQPAAKAGMLLPTASPLGFCYLCPHPWERASLWPDFVCWLCKAWQLVSAFCVTMSNLPGDKVPAWPDLPSSRFCATVSQVQSFQGWNFRSSLLLLCTKLDFWAYSVHLEQGWVHHLWDSVQKWKCRVPCSEIKNDKTAATWDPSEPEPCTVYTSMKLALPQDLRG